jgi:transposase
VKTLNLQSDYSKNGSYIQLCLPIETEVFIPVDNSVRLLDQVLEELDYSKLYRSYSSLGRNPSVSPKRLFKVMVYAYSQGIYSTRKIEEACRLNLAFQYLLRGDPIPDHNIYAGPFSKRAFGRLNRRSVNPARRMVVRAWRNLI